MKIIAPADHAVQQDQGPVPVGCTMQEQTHVALGAFRVFPDRMAKDTFGQS